MTTESVEFLESGVILRVMASVDRHGRILLEIHPEVSTGTINDGLPSQTTAEVTTKLLADDGQKVFIGGLIKDRMTQSRSGARFLRKIPIIGFLFSKYQDVTVASETVVLISAHVMEEGRQSVSREKIQHFPAAERALRERRQDIEREFKGFGAPEPAQGEPTPAPVDPNSVGQP